MFDLGISEIILVLFLIIIFIRPEDLPALIRKCGQVYGKIMRIYYAVLDEIQDVADMDPRSVNKRKPRD